MNAVFAFTAIHIQPFLLPHYFGICDLPSVISAAPSQFLYSCYIHIHSRYSRLTGEINIMYVHLTTFKFSASLCDMLHSCYYIIIIIIIIIIISIEWHRILTGEKFALIKSASHYEFFGRTKIEMLPIHFASTSHLNST